MVHLGNVRSGSSRIEVLIQISCYCVNVHDSFSPAVSFQLMFSVHNNDGLFSARTEVCPHCLCDNKWHTVTAELIKNVATVRVDGRKLRVGVSKGYEQSLNTNHELYIGGFPSMFFFIWKFMQ